MFHGISEERSRPHTSIIAAESVDRQLREYAADLRESHGRELAGARELQESYLATVRALSAAVEAKDGYTGGHIQRVHDLGMLLARHVAPEEMGDPQLAYGFLLHDVGKLAVPDAILSKPGPLDDEEWRIMRTHPEAGAGILSGIPFLHRAMGVVLHHHERWDGGGYPMGLAGESIPIGARIFAVADAVDAITSHRPYRRALTLEEAVAEVLDGAGTHFDPVCARAMAEVDRLETMALLSSDRPAAG